MASSQLVDFDFSFDNFNHTKFCPACQNRTTFKVPLAFFHLNGLCKLTSEQEKMCHFSCTCCGWLTEVHIKKLYAERCEMKLKRETLFVTKRILQAPETVRNRNEFKMIRNNVQMEAFKRNF